MKGLFSQKNKAFLSFAAICGPGLIREDNQDNIYCDRLFRKRINSTDIFQKNGIRRGNALFAVADGMGGEANGAQASLEVVRDLDKVDKSGGASAVSTHLLQVNELICAMISEDGGRRMGSTFAGVLFEDDQVHIINIGDSRVYLFRDDQLTQQSVDDTLVRPMVEMGILTAEAARSHPNKHRLSQHLGIFPDELLIGIHEKTTPINRGDIFLLCSDGLTDMLTDEEIAVHLKSKDSIKTIANALFSAAMNGGGKDNISILLVKSEGRL